MPENNEPFDNAEEVWFWFCNCLKARGEGLRARQDYSKNKRSIEVADVHRIIKRMKHLQQINNRVLRIMVKWGEEGFPPNHSYRAKQSEIKLWECGISYFDYHLRQKGVL